MKFWQLNLLSNMMHLSSSHMTNWCEGLENSLQVTSPDSDYGIFPLLPSTPGTWWVWLDFSPCCAILPLCELTAYGVSYWHRHLLLVGGFRRVFCCQRVSETLTSGLLNCHVVFGFPLMPSLKALINTLPFWFYFFIHFVSFHQGCELCSFSTSTFFFFFSFLRDWRLISRRKAALWLDLSINCCLCFLQYCIVFWLLLLLDLYICIHYFILFFCWLCSLYPNFEFCLP